MSRKVNGIGQPKHPFCSDSHLFFPPAPQFSSSLIIVFCLFLCLPLLSVAVFLTCSRTDSVSPPRRWYAVLAVSQPTITTIHDRPRPSTTSASLPLFGLLSSPLEFLFSQEQPFLALALLLVALVAPLNLQPPPLITPLGRREVFLPSPLDLESQHLLYKFALCRSLCQIPVDAGTPSLAHMREKVCVCEITET